MTFDEGGGGIWDCGTTTLIEGEEGQEWVLHCGILKDPQNPCEAAFEREPCLPVCRPVGQCGQKLRSVF